MVIFHSYVSLPEGIFLGEMMCVQHFPMLSTGGPTRSPLKTAPKATSSWGQLRDVIREEMSLATPGTGHRARRVQLR